MTIRPTNEETRAEAVLNELTLTDVVVPPMARGMLIAPPPIVTAATRGVAANAAG